MTRNARTSHISPTENPLFCDFCDDEINEDIRYCARCGETCEGYRMDDESQMDGWEGRADYLYDLYREDRSLFA